MIENERRRWVTGVCPSGKRGFVQRAGAQAAARLLAKRGHDKLRPYLCACGYWHVGHKPGPVMRGQVSAAEFYGPDGAA